MEIEIKLKHIISLIVCIVIFFTTRYYYKNEINNIEIRLKEVCFLYNKECDPEIDRCYCMVKADNHNINYIFHK